MKSIRETKQLVLFCLSLQTTIFGEHAGDSYTPYKFLYDRLPLRPASIRNALSALIRNGQVNKLVTKSSFLQKKQELSKIKKINRQPVVNLSVSGKKQLQSFLPVLFSNKRTKFGFLLIVFLAKSKDSKFELKKAVQRKARQSLQQLGFVKLQRGVYCGWHGLLSKAESVIMEYELVNQTLLLPFEKTPFFKQNELSYKLLGLQQVSFSCLKLINRIHQLLGIVERKKELQDKDNQAIKQAVKESFFILKKLPALPKSLTPPDWPVIALKVSLKQLSDSI